VHPVNRIRSLATVAGHEKPTLLSLFGLDECIGDNALADDPQEIARPKLVHTTNKKRTFRHQTIRDFYAVTVQRTGSELRLLFGPQRL
jgi:hypothetical protein